MPAEVLRPFHAMEFEDIGCLPAAMKAALGRSTVMFFNVPFATVVTLEDANNFRGFKVVVAMPNADLETVRCALANIAVLPDRDTAWVFEQVLREWPDLMNDPAWQDALTAMIEKARPHGWIDDANKTIKAHVQWTG